MRVLRDEFFIRKDFAFYDSCLSATMPIGALAVYELLRRHVWVGSPLWGFDVEKKLYNQRLLYAVLTQTTQASMLGVSKTLVFKHIQVLRKLGWIYPVKRHRGRSAYVLGNTEPYYPSIWWADIWLNQLYVWMLRTSKVRREPISDWQSTGDPGLDAINREERCELYEGLSPIHDISLADIPLEDRLRMVKKFYAVALETEDVRESVKLTAENIEGKQ